MTVFHEIKEPSVVRVVVQDYWSSQSGAILITRDTKKVIRNFYVSDGGKMLSSNDLTLKFKIGACISIENGILIE